MKNNCCSITTELQSRRTGAIMQEPWKYEKLLSLGNYMCLNNVSRIKLQSLKKQWNQNQHAIYNHIFNFFIFPLE